jgi:glycosyltransferase involved in cell wall biosynthesis
MKVLFVHENTLGHGSYLPSFVEYFRQYPELGIEPQILNATPLPPELAGEADRTMRGLRRFGLDNHFARWRNVVSAHVRNEVDQRAGTFDALVVNTQSVGLDLVDVGKPIFAALDATFQQLSQGRWFSNPPLGRIAPKLISNLIDREKKIFTVAAHILPWSRQTRESLVTDYGLAETKICVLPPSIEVPPPRTAPQNPMPRILFVGGDFKRKGGDILLACYRRFFCGRVRLDLVTQTEIQPETGVSVWRDVQARSSDWKNLWNSADIFIFPSRLETFGIVLVEALTFGVPIISSKAGAAEEILDGGRAGILLENLSAENLAASIENVLANRKEAEDRALFGRRRAMEEYSLAKNSERLARLLQ